MASKQLLFGNCRCTQRNRCCDGGQLRLLERFADCFADAVACGTVALTADCPASAITCSAMTLMADRPANRLACSAMPLMADSSAYRLACCAVSIMALRLVTLGACFLASPASIPPTAVPVSPSAPLVTLLNLRFRDDLLLFDLPSLAIFGNSSGSDASAFFDSPFRTAVASISTHFHTQVSSLLIVDNPVYEGMTNTDKDKCRYREKWATASAPERTGLQR